QTSIVGDSVSLQIETSNPDGRTLVYDELGLPDGLEIDTDTGLISGMLHRSAGRRSPYNVTILVDDWVSNAVTATFNWTVGLTNHAPVLPSLDDLESAAGDSLDGQLTATDADEDVLTYTATGLPNGMSLNPGTGELSGTIAATAAFATPYTVTFIA